MFYVCFFLHLSLDCLNHPVGNGTFPSGFPGQEGQNAHCSQTSWNEEPPQESPSAWDTAACVGSKVMTDSTKLGFDESLTKKGWLMCVYFLLLKKRETKISQIEAQLC